MTFEYTISGAKYGVVAFAPIGYFFLQHKLNEEFSTKRRFEHYQIFLVFVAVGGFFGAVAGAPLDVFLKK